MGIERERVGGDFTPVLIGGGAAGFGLDTPLGRCGKGACGRLLLPVDAELVLRWTFAPEPDPPGAGAVCLLTGGGLLPGPVDALGRGEDDVDGRGREPEAGWTVGAMLLL